MRTSNGSRLRSTLHPMGTYWLVGEGRPHLVRILDYTPGDHFVTVYDTFLFLDRIVPVKMLSSQPRHRNHSLKRLRQMLGWWSRQGISNPYRPTLKRRQSRD